MSHSISFVVVHHGSFFSSFRSCNKVMSSCRHVACCILPSIVLTQGIVIHHDGISLPTRKYYMQQKMRMISTTFHQSFNQTVVCRFVTCVMSEMLDVQCDLLFGFFAQSLSICQLLVCTLQYVHVLHNLVGVFLKEIYTILT